MVPTRIVFGVMGQLRGWASSGSIVLRLLAPLGVLIFCAGVANAQSWPEFSFPRQHELPRGPGSYLAWYKLLSYWVMFLLWVKTTDWVSQDGQKLGMPHAIWNPVVFGVFLVGFLLGGFLLPSFAISLPVVILAWMVPLLAYVFQRNGKVEPHERVMTPAHLRFLLSVALGKIGIKIDAEARAAHEKGAQVDFQASGATQEESQTNLIKARQGRGFISAKGLIAAAIDHRAEKIMLDFGQSGVTSRYQVDGVWHDADERDREEGDAMLGVLKILGGVAPEERRKRQEGTFWSEYDGRKLQCQLVSQGTKTGERTLLSFGKSGAGFKALDELGMREKMIDRLKEMMLTKNGIFLFASMPGGGLSTTMSVSLSCTDRLLRDFVAVEDENEPMFEVENVDSEFYNATKGESPMKHLDAIARKQPDVVVCPNLTDKETVERLCAMAEEEQLIFATMRAKEAVEVLLRVLLLKVPAKTFAPRVVGVLNQRLVRRLCETCKEAFEPPPSLLKKLGIPAGRVEVLYRHPENPEKVCPDCKGIGYVGRVGVFELLTVDATMREALIKSPKLDVLRQLARRGGHRTLQEEGIAAVVQGITSLPELMRVLKQ